ncbi:hypothetical protein B0H63DRAFT_552764 [Podospora didyma]|uniref:Uncharacterized protein n=1 Tax=Podospora didyma TaxID=330526 RepID=A0AAE0N5X4_9PEZI|nr:hypothetical protein B0H63DRAFT_552764 [Podospora didyma]
MPVPESDPVATMDVWRDVRATLNATREGRAALLTFTDASVAAADQLRLVSLAPRGIRIVEDVGPEAADLADAISRKRDVYSCPASLVVEGESVVDFATEMSVVREELGGVPEMAVDLVRRYLVLPTGLTSQPLFASEWRSERGLKLGGRPAAADVDAANAAATSWDFPPVLPQLMAADRSRTDSNAAIVTPAALSPEHQQPPPRRLRHVVAVRSLRGPFLNPGSQPIARRRQPPPSSSSDSLSSGVGSCGTTVATIQPPVRFNAEYHHILSKRVDPFPPLRAPAEEHLLWHAPDASYWLRPSGNTAKNIRAMFPTMAPLFPNGMMLPYLSIEHIRPGSADEEALAANRLAVAASTAVYSRFLLRRAALERAHADDDDDDDPSIGGDDDPSASSSENSGRHFATLVPDLNAVLKEGAAAYQARIRTIVKATIDLWFDQLDIDAWLNQESLRSNTVVGSGNNSSGSSESWVCESSRILEHDQTGRDVSSDDTNESDEAERKIKKWVLKTEVDETPEEAEYRETINRSVKCSKHINRRLSKVAGQRYTTREMIKTRQYLRRLGNTVDLLHDIERRIVVQRLNKLGSREKFIEDLVDVRMAEIDQELKELRLANADLKHFGITIGLDTFQVWVAEPWMGLDFLHSDISTSARQTPIWEGCIVRKLFEGDVTSVANVSRLAKFIMGVHAWGMSEYLQGVLKDAVDVPEEPVGPANDPGWGWGSPAGQSHDNADVSAQPLQLDDDIYDVSNDGAHSVYSQHSIHDADFPDVPEHHPDDSAMQQGSDEHSQQQSDESSPELVHGGSDTPEGSDGLATPPPEVWI